MRKASIGWAGAHQILLKGARRSLVRAALNTILLLYSTLGFSQSHSFDTTLVADNYEVKIETKDISEELVLLKTTFNSTIVHLDTINGGGLSDIQFPDFDNDGDRDIVLTYMGNNPIYFLYLFDSKCT
jgi:hypothetical protein